MTNQPTLIERSKFRSYEIKLDLGSSIWLRDTVRILCLDRPLIGTKVFHRNSTRMIWLDKAKNKRGWFMKISVCEKSYVKFVIVPEGGGQKEGWRALA